MTEESTLWWCICATCAVKHQFQCCNDLDTRVFVVPHNHISIKLINVYIFSRHFMFRGLDYLWIRSPY